MTDEPGASAFRVMNLHQAIGEPDERVRDRACEAVGVAPQELRGFRIARRALDARRRAGRRRLHFVVHAELTLDAQAPRSRAFEEALRAGRAVPVGPPARFEVAPDPSLAGGRVVVVGAGPAGLLAALVLARSGVAVDLLDRGPSLVARGRAVARFQRTRELDPEANLLFGEGGAGTYSDGKLYTRVDHPLESLVLEELVACGAPDDIRYDARAHIGTDRLHRVLPALRARLEALGVVFHWSTRLEGLIADEGPLRTVRAVQTSTGELPCRAVVLAPGHSASDTLRALAEQGVAVEAKPFQLGVRVEHPQTLIDRGRHGDGPEAALLGPASYGLVARGRPGAHSFCMCPGGQIVASVSAPGLLCTNGMSNSRHSSPWATAAIVTTLGRDQLGPGAFAGVAFQEALEARFYEAGGGDYTAPAQRVPDFLAGRDSRDVARTSYKLGTTPARIDRLLPPDVTAVIAQALVRFERQIPGFAGAEGLLVGIESRSAAPVRLPRDEERRRAAGFANLFPAGEGAGWAGGIMSAAIDGARSAQALLRYGVR